MDGATQSTCNLSYWLKDALCSEHEPLIKLDCDLQADVCIVGGGFTGLWSAIEIKQTRPELEVVLVERDLCGSGASGRNGGFVLSLWAKFVSLAKMCGEVEAERLCIESSRVICDLKEFCEKNSIDAELRLDGWLWTATSAAQIGTWGATIAATRRRGHAPFEVLSHETVPLGGSRAHLAGVFERISASVQPAKLARGLRRHAVRLGVKVFEKSPMVGLDRGVPAQVRCQHGTVKAQKVILAMNAWGSVFSEIRKAIAVVSSDIVITRRLPRLLEAIHWTDGMTISDCRMLVHYYRTTPDGRIVFGKGGGSGKMAFGSKVEGRFDGRSPIESTVADWLSRIYPEVMKQDVAQSWTGPIDRSSNGLPSFGALPGSQHIFYGVGYSGNGVGPSMLGGKILRSLALGVEDDWSRCGLVQPLQRAFPPEPFRYVGAQIVRRAVAQSDHAADEGRAPGMIVRGLTRLAPAGLSPIRTNADGSDNPPAAA
ncbi:Glycine/D-amino acid oxidase, deaminating [Paraburkholderia ribeironis]|uniref:Glycine/D-amino acid oxidase, deaminating n=1 Tax=Paraburkholderia ribeironis TaxID=1247936 RepID=A0A1N7RXE8_9BURK|nr:FAD-dependent oxidoreductase [Paraburkholderia ribeironis]SIT39788.1 Glycine/D-amino acid oxidase, deaminating [Paraburkholderia ribeironis]